MKKKILFALTLVAMLVCVLAISVSAEAKIYDDAPARVNLEVRTDDIIKFDDGFEFLSAYVFKDVTNLYENNSRLANFLDFSYVNEKAGKEYTAANIVEVDIPQGVTAVGKYTFISNSVVKRVSFPDSVTSLGNAIFQSATGLEECVLEFDESSSITRFPSYMFYGCSNLKAFSMPDCFTEIYDVATFKGCTKMTAV